MRIKFGVALAALISLPAQAQVSEVRAGVAKHDLNVFSAVDQKEASGALQAEIVFDKPNFFKARWAPKPYVGGTLNLGGKTSYGGAGFVWRAGLGERFYGDFAFGLVVHDGALEAPRAELSPEFRDYLDTFDGDFPGIGEDPVLDAGFAQFFAEGRRLRDTNLEYGSRVLFREQLTLGYRIDERWAAEAFFEHISHGHILSDRANDGSDAGGFRVALRF